MMKSTRNSLIYFNNYLIINRKYKNKILLNKIFQNDIHITKMKFNFVQKNKKINKNIYNMNCIELYRYTYLLEKKNINNIIIYKQINKRVEMIYKFLNPSKIILLVKLYLENNNFHNYKNTFICLLQQILIKLNEFNIEEIVKLYNIISKVENNQTIVYLFKYINNHLIHNYTSIDIKSFAIILNAHAKLKIKDMKLINKFLNIIIQQNLTFDILNYSIYFNTFYKLKIINNQYVHTIINKFFNEINICLKQNILNQINTESNKKNGLSNNKEHQIILDKFANYKPHHICNILLYLTIYKDVYLMGVHKNKISNMKRDEKIIQYDQNGIQYDQNGIQYDGDSMKCDGDNIKGDGDSIKGNGDSIKGNGDNIKGDGEDIKCDEKTIQYDQNIIQYDQNTIQYDQKTIQYDQNNTQHSIYEHIKLLYQFIIKKKEEIHWEEILMLCQIFKILKIKNDILVDYIEKKLLQHFQQNDTQLINKNTELIKILFDMCTYYNDINIYKHSISYFLKMKNKKYIIDFYSALLLLYTYSEINILDYDIISLLVHIIKKKYMQHFQEEHIFLLIRSIYKICINNQHYFVYTQNKGDDLLNDHTMGYKLDNKHNIVNMTSGDNNNIYNDDNNNNIYNDDNNNNIYNDDNNNNIYNNVYNNNAFNNCNLDQNTDNTINKINNYYEQNDLSHMSSIHMSKNLNKNKKDENISFANYQCNIYPTNKKQIPHDAFLNTYKKKKLFYKIKNLNDQIFTKLQTDLLSKKIELYDMNISIMCKILYYSVFLRNFIFINNVIHLFINYENEKLSFKNILNILYSYVHTKKNYIYNKQILQQINVININEANKHIEHVINKNADNHLEILSNFYFLINNKKYVNQLKNMIYYMFLQSKINIYSFINMDIIKTLVHYSFLNIHLLSTILNTLLSKDLNVINIIQNEDNNNDENEDNNNNNIYSYRAEGEYQNVHTSNNMLNNPTNIYLQNISTHKDIELYNKIFTHINTLILKCHNIYDITRIFNASFILLNHIQKITEENKFYQEYQQLKIHIYDTLEKIEKNILQNYVLYNKEFIMLLSAICIYNNNYSYIPFCFFYKYFEHFVFQQSLSYCILLSNDEELKHFSNLIYELSKCNFINNIMIERKNTKVELKYPEQNHNTNRQHENDLDKNIPNNNMYDHHYIEQFYYYHIQQIINSIDINTNEQNVISNKYHMLEKKKKQENIIHTNIIDKQKKNKKKTKKNFDDDEEKKHIFQLNNFEINNIINIYKVLINNYDILSKYEIFNKIKDIYLYSSKIIHVILNNLPLYELNKLCLLILKNKIPNTYLFQHIIKYNSEYINLKDYMLDTNYIIDILNIFLNIKKYNIFIDNNIVINIITKNINMMNTPQQINSLLELIYLMKNINIDNNLILETSKNIYSNYLLTNTNINIGEIIYFLYLLNHFNNYELLNSMFCIFYNLWSNHMKTITIRKNKKLQLNSSLNNTFYIAKYIYTFEEKHILNLTNKISSYSKKHHNLNDEYILYINEDSNIPCHENGDLHNAFTSNVNNQYNEIYQNKQNVENHTTKDNNNILSYENNYNNILSYDHNNNQNCHHINKQFNMYNLNYIDTQISKKNYILHMNDHTFIILFFILGFQKNNDKSDILLKIINLYKSCFSIFKEHIYICNKEIIIQCLYIYFNSEINNLFIAHKQKELKNNQIIHNINDQIIYILNILITFIHNLDIQTVLKFSFIYIHFFNSISKKTYNVKHNIILLMKHINNNKKLIENNNILYEQIKSYANMSPY
ncbi:hypothetical protein PFFVO_01208 [Plasmodium falciparum Vietnam Oak-Knoll (FVO)]|uniref:Uncharacterized protein n=1 Tax=Plasmodium falciparum Vietnam Oak-Knoll (FVO) TaxID=1036723 RepID=A0A024VA59_PLAFA|nr:hypothetical protein PFFVO_01208 [Plasmodium falciparum Vietnam Oak-Knoll (FVO)]